ncbi:Family of serine hydrolases 3 [Parahypoxylon ruwenzoriense]
MSTTEPTGQPTSSSKPATIPTGKTELRILMLHGFTQSGPLFSSKTKALSKLLVKALSPAPYNLHPTLLYPTGPHRLRPSDIPGYVPAGAGAASEEGGEAEARDEDDSDNWAWFRKDEATGAYRGLSEGMHAIASAIRDSNGPIDGVVGFSQGGATAALVASALEYPYRPLPLPPAEKAEEDLSWVSALRSANADRPLRFCVVYSGFWAPPRSLQWLYEPPIGTPTLHFLGSLDTVVDESRSRALIDRCRDPDVVVHPGGHYVPVAKDWVMALIGWLRQRYNDKDKIGPATM